MRWLPEGIPWSKRVLDLLFVLMGMVIALPLMGLIALAILLFEGPPVFFLSAAARL